ncbi:heparinase II/III domain-containing protein [Snuella lapsa]|uniref:Heparinase II/III-like C-terminal domain-containing protein n=1 Tax=Snuella lapsa TaxID=870481 RepID=A0ABP6YEA0_9FLAO
MADRAVKVFHHGKVQNNQQLMDTAKKVMEYYDPIGEITSNKFGDMYSSLTGIFDFDFLKSYMQESVSKDEVWFPDLELLCTSQMIKGKRLFLSVLGGHNAQSHNHNDVGNYTIFVNGEPAIIDVGVEQYTKKSFSSQRYDIWTMQSAYHNLPTINGTMQKDGLQYRTHDVIKSKNALKMNIEAAYPEEAKIKSWVRSFKTSKAGILISDVYKLEQNLKGIVLNNITPLEIKNVQRGVVELSRNEEKVLYIKYDPEQLQLRTEEIVLTDDKLKSEWKQDKLYRIQLIVKNNDPEGEIRIKYY